MKSTSGARKGVLGGLAAIGAVLVLSSAAFACTAFKGHMWVQKGTASEGHAIGNGTGMGYCTGTTPTTGGVTRGTGFTVNVAPTSATDPCPNQSLGGNSTKFQVLWTTSTGHCMAGTGNKIGTITVTSGSGSGSGYQIPTTATAGPGKVCVSDNAALKGMEVPVTVA